MTSPVAEVRRPLLPGPLRTQLGWVLHGIGALDGLPAALARHELERLLVLTGPNAAEGETVARVQELLGESGVHLFTGCRAHSPVEVVNEIVGLARDYGVDGFVTIGGGSTVDTAKVAAAVIGEGAPPEELISEFRPPETYIERYLRRPKPPVVAIPSTLSGAETGPRAGFISADRIKRIIEGDFLAARVLVLDPAATLGVDLNTFLFSGMNGLAHCIEGLYSRRRNPLADALALEAIRLFWENLVRVKEAPEDLEPRLRLLYAGYLGGLVLLNSRMGIHHAVAHCLGGRLGLSHGTANAILLPYAMAYNLAAASGPLARAAQAMGVACDGLSDDDLAAAAVKRVRELRDRLGVPNRLRDLPAPPSEADLEQVIDDVRIERGLLFNPRLVDDRRDVAELVGSAY